MEGAYIGIFEANDGLRDVYRRYFERKGHSVTLSASSSGEAFPLVEDYTDRLDVALVDLDPGNHSPRERETEEIIELLRTKFGGTVSIITVLSSGIAAQGANKHFEKMDYQGIMNYINRL